MSITFEKKKGPEIESEQQNQIETHARGHKK